MKHIPVLALQVLNAFKKTNVIKNGCYVDLTLGLGGHAALVMKTYEPKTVVAMDRDEQMLKLGEAVVRKSMVDCSISTIDLKCIHASYSEINQQFPKEITSTDAVLMDLGVASPHFDDSERGMSIRLNGPLDMRLDRSQALTAATVVNTYSEKELGRIFRDFGEERHWRAAARTLVSLRNEPGYQGIQTTFELVHALEPVLGPRSGRIHPATKIFQAIRMAVNDELDHLEIALPKVISRLTSPGGCLAVISFHSLEDRIVKQTFLHAAQQGLASFVSKKPLTAEKDEIAANPRSRSAKLRYLIRA